MAATIQLQPQALDIARYDVRSPRYTSYPTALQFRDDFSAEDYAAWWPHAATAIAPLSLYVHVPFCRDICYYCGCNKIVTRRSEDARRYLKKKLKCRPPSSAASVPCCKCIWVAARRRI